jgi:hypothetical protein
MRCPSCGTENAPDSRFCGGCGARLGQSSQRVAPTQKISDDASYPQPPTGPGPSGYAAQVTAPPPARSVPPAPYAVSGGSPRTASTPPGYPNPPVGSRPPDNPVRPSEARPRTASIAPSLSMPIAARRPWGLIAVVLVLDLGLAVSGAWMLTAGLSERPASPAPSAKPATTGAIQVTPIEPRAAVARGSAQPTPAATPAAGPPGDAAIDAPERRPAATDPMPAETR